MDNNDRMLFGGNQISISNTVDEKEIIIYDADEKSENEQMDDDLAEARKTYKDIIATGKEAMEKMTTIIDETESPRAVEVMATLLKTVGDTADKLIDMHIKKKGMKAKLTAEVGILGAPVQNNYYVSSTDDLQNLFSNKRKEKTVEVKDDRDDRDI